MNLQPVAKQKNIREFADAKTFSVSPIITKH